jgi:hypothetical protein
VEDERKQYLMDRFGVFVKPSFQDMFWAILDVAARILAGIEELKAKR